MEQVQSPVADFLASLGIGYEWIEIPLTADQKPVRSLEDLVRASGQEPGQIVRSLVFRTGGGDFVLLAIAGSGRADWAALRKAVGERRLTLAEPAQVLEATGYPIGAVPPLALPAALRLLVDEGVFAYDKVIIGSGVLGYALELVGEDLRKALQGAEIGQFAKA